MTSLRKQQANRDNAKASTGPKSAAGKTRSARNAHRHGLAVPVWSNKELAADAEALARLIAGAGASTELLEKARCVAEAQIDWIRASAARRNLIEPAFGEASYFPRKETNWPAVFDTDGLALIHGPATPEKLALVMTDLSPQLRAIDRYQRRALSRRKFAIREFDAVREQEARTNVHHLEKDF